MTAPILDLDLPPEHPLRQILDFISAHPEVRQPVLRALLTEDFLALPIQVQELTDRVDGLAGQVEELRDDVASFKDETREQFRLVNTRIDETNTRIDENTRVLTENTVSTRRLEGHMGRMRGLSYEDSCRYYIGVILDGYLDGPVLADRERINVQLRKARRNDDISRVEYEHGLSPDIIARAEDDLNQNELLAVVEASITFNRRDLENAARRAAIIAKVTGVRTDAFVATHYPWPEDMDAAAQQLRVTVIRRESEEHAYDY